MLEDKVFIEYYAPATSEVVLHYIVEGQDAEDYRYTTCRLYPSYGGVYSKAFSLYAGEKITYFITEKRAEGQEISTPAITKEKETAETDSGTRYGRINQMRKLLEKEDWSALENKMQQCRFLEMAAEQLFPMK